MLNQKAPKLLFQKKNNLKWDIKNDIHNMMVIRF